MAFSPLFKTPMTDLTGCLVNHQNYGNCAKFELKYMDCMEAYGLDRGLVKCADIIEDFNECFSKKKQYERLWIMRQERHKQYYWTEKRKEHFADPPKIDSY